MLTRPAANNSQVFTAPTMATGIAGNAARRRGNSPRRLVGRLQVSLEAGARARPRDNRSEHYQGKRAGNGTRFAFAACSRADTGTAIGQDSPQPTPRPAAVGRIIRHKLVPPSRRPGEFGACGVVRGASGLRCRSVQKAVEEFAGRTRLIQR
jgi:hypothetical protein